MTQIFLILITLLAITQVFIFIKTAIVINRINKIWTKYSLKENERIIITNSGNVGINTTQPL